MSESLQTAETTQELPETQNVGATHPRWGRIIVWMNSTGSAVQALAGFGALGLVLTFFFGEVSGGEALAGLLTLWSVGVGTTVWIFDSQIGQF